MLKHGLEGVNLNNPIEDKLPQIIEYFVKFYGEKYRERIKERLNDAVILFIDKASVNRNADIKSHFSNIRTNLMQTFREKVKENTDAVFYENNSLGYLNSKELDTLSRWKYRIYSIDLENVTNFLKHFDRNLNTETLAKALKSERMEEIYSFLSKIDDIYQEFREDLIYIENEKEKYLNASKETKGLTSLTRIYDEEANNLLFQNLVLNFNLPISAQSRAKFDEFAPIYLDFINKNSKFIIKNDIDHLLPFFDYINSFSNSQQIHRTLYDYLNDITFMEKLLPEQLKTSLDKLKREKEIQLTPIISGKSENLSKIYNGDFILEDAILAHINSYINISSNSKTAAFMMSAPSYSNKKQSAICVLGTFFQLFDSHLVHEFNHIIEMDYVVENGYFKTKCGFDYDKCSVAGGYKNSLSNCELLNEIVNDYLSRKVLKLMQADNFTIGHRSDSGSTYTKAFPLLSQFIEDNIEDIIEARMSDTPMLFTQKIGKENIETLSNATSNLLEILKQFPFYYAEANIRNILNINGELDLFSIKPDKRFSNNTNDILKCFNDVKSVMDKINLKNNENSIQIDENIEKND